MSKITSDELADLSGFISQLKEALALVKDLKEDLTVGLKKATSGSSGKVNIIDSESLKKTTQEMDKMNLSLKELEALQKKEIKIASELTKLEKEKIKTERELIKNQIILTKESERLNKAKEKSNGLYAKESKRLNDLRRQFKDMALAEGTATKATRALQKQITTLDTKLKKVDASAGQFQRNVGNYGASVKEGVRQTSRFAMSLAGGAGLISIMRGGFNTVKEFNQSIANLSAITGATGKDLDFLKDKAKEMGRTTTLSASQVAEGFKLIASAKPELLDNAEALAMVTEQAITLAEAAGIELPEAASALANTMNQFGAGAEDAAKFVDVLAAGAKFGAGDINFLNEAMINAGTVASDAGLEINEAAAALEILAAKGLPASKAGNQFKNVLLNLQKAGIGFVDGQFNLQAALGEVKGQLESIDDPAKKAAFSINLFGKENIVAGKSLLNGTAALAEMTENLDKNGIAAEQQAANNDTLEGAVKRLQSAWEGFILDISEGAGSFISLKDILNFIADNLVTIIKVVTVAASAWLSFKVALGAQRFYQNIGKSLTGMGRGMKFLGGAFKKGAFSARTFGAALKSIPFVGIVSGITTIVTSLSLFSDSTDDAAEQQEILNQAFEDGKTAADDFNASIENNIKMLRDQIAASISAAKANGASNEALAAMKTKGAEEVLKKTIEQRDAMGERETDLIEAEISILDARSQLAKAQQDYNDSITRRTTKGGHVVETSDTNLKMVMSLRQAELNIITAKGAKLANVNGMTITHEQVLVRIKTEQEKLDVHRVALGLEINGLNTELTASKNAQDALDQAAIDKTNKLAKAHGKYLDSLKKRLQDLQDAGITDDADREIRQLKRKFDRELETIKGKSKVENDLRLEIETTFQREKLLIIKKYKQKFIEVESDYFKKIDDEIKRREDEKQRITDENLADELEAADFGAKLKELRLIKSGKTEEEIAEQQRDDKIFRLKEEIAILEFYDIEAMDKKIELAQLEADKIKSIDEKALDEKIKRTQDAAAILTALSNKADERADKNIERIDKQVAASEAAQERLKALADAGNLEATKSITAEIHRQEALEKEKQKLERRKQLREIGLAAFKGYAAKVESGSDTPVVDTLKDLSTLALAIRSIPAFFDGVDDTGAGGSIDSKGGFLSVLHPNERVMTKEQNSKMHGYKNEDVAEIVSQYHANQTYGDVSTVQLLTMPNQDNEIRSELNRINSTMNKSVEYMKEVADKPVHMGTNYNQLTKSFEDIYVLKNGIEKRIQKLNNGL